LEAAPRHWTALREMFVVDERPVRLPATPISRPWRAEPGATIYSTDRDSLPFPGVRVINPLSSATGA
jgi:hypothetical protein